jgi:hypothetical protein
MTEELKKMEEPFSLTIQPVKIEISSHPDGQDYAIWLYGNEEESQRVIVYLVPEAAQHIVQKLSEHLKKGAQ